MKKNNKRRIGFTIVELVIVIGVIGVLSAILIPTFVNLNGKAKEASNKSFVSEINKQLAINDALEDGNSEKHVLNNLHDVKKFLADERGFDITKIIPSDGTELVWDQKADKFALVYPNGEVAFADFELTPLAHEKWIVAKDGSKFAPSARIRRGLSTKDADPFDGYSVYLADNNYDGNISVSAGFDAGDNNKIGKVTYNTNDDKDVIIRTSSAKTDVEVTSHGSVDFYGVGSINYKDAENIYLNDNVNIPFLEVTKGRIVIGEKAKVKQIHLVSDGQSFDDITIAIESGATLPKISRDPVSFNPEGTLVVAIQDGNISDDAEKQYVWLYQHGVVEELVVTTDTKTFNNSDKASNYTGSNLYEIAKNIAYELADGYDWEVVKNLDEDEITSLVTDSGLSTSQKTSAKSNWVDKVAQEELVNNSSCPHNWVSLGGRHYVNSDTGEKEYVETKECRICNEQIKEISHHDVLGAYCNTCKHPVAFVDIEDDFTVNDTEHKMMPVILNILGGYDGPSDIDLYLDIAYSFKAYPNMETKKFDDSKYYKLDLENFVFSETSDPNAEGIIMTEQGIFEFFGEWFCDYYVSFDGEEGVMPYTCGLGGYYESFGASVGFVVPDLNSGNPIPVNYEVPLLGTMLSDALSDWSYKKIADVVGEFKCGFFNLSEDNIGKTFIVKLRMLNPDASDGYDYQYPVHNDVLGIELPNYIDVGVTKYIIKSPSENNMGIVRDFLENNPEYKELFN